MIKPDQKPERTGKGMYYAFLMLLILLLVPGLSKGQNGNGMYDAIFAGSYNSCGGTSYALSGNNSSYSNNFNSNNSYSAQPSGDVWYKFNITEYSDIHISTCGSSLDTYIHLLDANGNIISQSDDGSCGLQSSIFWDLGVGTYYVVVEGKSYNTGSFNLAVSSSSSGTPPAGATMSNPIEAGTYSNSGSFSNTMNEGTACLGNNYEGLSSKDIFYKFTLTTAATVILSHCGSDVDTYMTLLNSGGGYITHNDDSGVGQCPSWYEAYIEISLPAGTYYVVSESNYYYSPVPITTNINVVMTPVVTYNGVPSIFTVGTAVSINPTVTNAPSTGSFSISPSLPAGLVFNTANGSISGTPAILSPATTYTVVGYSAAPVTITFAVTSGSSPDQNYILTYRPRRETGYSTAEAVEAGSANAADVQTTIQYVDGLGRPLQTVQVKGSADALKDLVIPNEYDAYGREAKKYLPYASSSNNGSYKPAALTEVISYYNAPKAGLSGTFNTPYSKTEFEPSPLHRVVEQGAPGNPWQPAVSGISGSGHTVKTGYATNTLNEVRRWYIYGSGANSDYTYYYPGQLYKTFIKDENWQASDGKAGTTEEFKDKDGRVVHRRVWETASKALNTAYIYDHYGNLRYVVPPLGDDYSDPWWAEVYEGSTHFNNYIYAYHYDHRQRLIEKKIPGKGWEYLIYNKLDQVVATQDAEQRKNGQWLTTKYDVFGRVISTGTYADTISFTDPELLLSEAYDKSLRRKLLQESVSAETQLWETYDNSSGNYGYSNVSFPRAVWEVFTINYYDRYDFPGNTYGGPSGSQSSNVKGYQTASKVNVLGSSTMLLSVNYYDAEGRVVQSKADNYVGGSDIVSNTYSFSGELKTSTRQHTSSTASATVATRYEYDHMGRKKESYENINSQGEVKLSALTYTETGQLLSKSLHNNNQSTGYTYNERGWLKNSTSPQFSFQLNYQDGTIPQYNGNISNQLWGASTPNANTFSYSYGRLNRLTNGTATGMSEILTYDEMGNIKTMNRDGSSGTYNYTGNRLDQIVNGTLATQAYEYDDNGNVIYDGRNQKTIGYNILNLPQTVSGGISYTYDANGRKLKKQSATTTHYVDGIQYTGGTIDFIQTEEGRALNMAGTYKYEYNLSDHLGNVRYSFDIYNGAVRKLQEDNYYAFGKRKMPNTMGNPDNKYLYNGKELQDELGQYDYHARFYDPVIGRFSTLDPLADEFDDVSPYNYALNNPVLMIDPDGMAADSAKVNTPAPEVSPAVAAALVLNTVVIKATPFVRSNAIAFAGLLSWNAGWNQGKWLANPNNMMAFTGGIASVLMKFGVPHDALYGPPIVQSTEEKTADELLPGSLKRSPSYNPKYGNKTRKELTDLASKGDQIAKKMKKLIDQVPRLLDKNRNK